MYMMNLGAVCAPNGIDLANESNRVDYIKTLWRLSCPSGIDCALQGLSNPSSTVLSIKPLTGPLQCNAL